MQTKICSYTVDEYIERVRAFHSYPAPGVVLGGCMIDMAYQHLPKEGLFDVLCETEKCLPDAVQLLTPCTYGNGWLKIINTGRFALTFYEKRQGDGVRVYIDAAELEKWPEIKNWFFKLKSKKEQDESLLLQQIKEGGPSVCRVQPVKMDLNLIKTRKRQELGVCPHCHESYPLADGDICLGCQGIVPYTTSELPHFIAASEQE